MIIFKKFWKKLKYWEKGLIFGLIIGFLSNMELFGGLSYIFWLLGYFSICGLSSLISFNIVGKCASLMVKFGGLFLILLFGAIGTGIGIIIGKVKSKK